MRRTAIIVTAVCLAILSGVLPMVVIYQLQRDRALQSEQAHVGEYARWTLLRAGRVLADAKDTLARAAEQGIRDCSTEHIAQLRQIAMNSNSVSDIGFFRNGRLACTTLRRVDGHVRRWEGAVDLGQGYRLSLPVQPTQFRSNQPMIALYYGDYNALIKPDRLVDVLTDTNMT